MTTDEIWQPLADLIADYEGQGARIGLAVEGGDGLAFSHAGDEKFVAASTVKVPLMVELCRRIDAGTLRLDDRMTVTRDMYAPGSGVMLHLDPGYALSLKDLIYLMISISDNSATNILIGVTGMEPVNATMQALGMTRSNLGRLMQGRAAQGDEVENWASPNDYVRLIAAILDGKAASPQSCELMLDMLRKQQNRRRIVRFLPATGFDWGAKGGSVPGYVNDIGYVRAGHRRMIVSIFSSGFTTQLDAEEAIGRMSRAALIAGKLL